MNNELKHMPKIGDVYRHFKGFVVVVKEIARSTDDPNKCFVIYEEQSAKEVWARPLEEFISEVDHTKYPSANDRFRFTLIGTNFTREIHHNGFD